MDGENLESELNENRMPSKDLGPILKGWDYEPGTITVRKVRGSDGAPKLQLRLDLGMLQMEIAGRPDGVRPHGYESLLEYFEHRLKEYERRNGTELGFTLTRDQCQSLREESAQYYHRYLSLFVLEDFTGVVRDTDRNLRVLDLCEKFADNDEDRLMLEQYRPYITMMNSRAKASMEIKEKKYRDALETIQQALARIKEFYARFGQDEVYSQSNEVKILRRFAREIKSKMPVDPVEKLKSRLQKAIDSERYEEAAKLRDEIKKKSE